jgi:hypothetical protein
MNDLRRLFVVIRRRWWYIAVPAVVLALTGVWPLVQMTPHYRVSVTFLLTSRAPMNDTGDTLAYDFPAVSRGVDFRTRVSAQVGGVVTADEVDALLDVRNNAREVTITARGANPATLVPVRDAALAVLTQDGTLLWGKSGDTAVNIAVLRREDVPVREQPWFDALMSIMLRAGAGAVLGMVVVLYRR